MIARAGANGSKAWAIARGLSVGFGVNWCLGGSRWGSASASAPNGMGGLATDIRFQLLGGVWAEVFCIRTNAGSELRAEVVLMVGGCYGDGIEQLDEVVGVLQGAFADLTWTGMNGLAVFLLAEVAGRDGGSQRPGHRQTGGDAVRRISPRASGCRRCRRTYWALPIGLGLRRRLRLLVGPRFGRDGNTGMPGPDGFIKGIRGLVAKNFTIHREEALIVSFQADGFSLEEFPELLLGFGQHWRFVIAGVHAAASGILHGLQVVQHCHHFPGVFLMNTSDVFRLGILGLDSTRLDRLLDRRWKGAGKIPFEQESQSVSARGCRPGDGQIPNGRRR
jgi:hypothetical protein